MGPEFFEMLVFNLRLFEVISAAVTLWAFELLRSSPKICRSEGLMI